MSTGAIIGGVTGGVIVILLCCVSVLVFAVVYFWRRNQHAVKLVISSRLITLEQINMTACCCNQGYNPLPRQHIRMLLISLFYSDVA